MKFATLVLLMLTSFPSLAAEGAITHIVLCWLKDKGNETRIQEVIQVSRELSIIDSLEEIKVGTALPSERDIVDDSFDVGMVMTFKDQQSLQDYLVHEEHVKRVKQVLAPECAKVLIYDIVYDR